MQRENNFDVLRLLFAYVVVLAHCYDLSLKPSLGSLAYIANSRIAVEGFFAMSGYLIAGSYDRTPSLRSYFSKRALRILPAYWAALLASLAAGLSLSTLPVSSFLASSETWKFFFADFTFLTFLHPSLPGLFTHNPSGPTINGALWTIKTEVLFYLLLPAILFLCRRFGKVRVLAVLFLLSVLYRSVCEGLHRDALAKQLPGQLCFFAVGILIYFYSAAFLRHPRRMIASAAAACVVSWFGGGVAAEAIAVGLTVFCIALLLRPIPSPARYGDFSYGTYVFHYPLIQMLVAAGLFDWHPWWGVLIVFCLVPPLAAASWKFIESPSLGIGRKSPGRAVYQSFSAETFGSPSHR